MQAIAPGKSGALQEGHLFGAGIGVRGAGAAAGGAATLRFASFAAGISSWKIGRYFAAIVKTKMPNATIATVTEISVHFGT